MMQRFHIEKYDKDGTAYLVDRERGEQRSTPLRTAAEAIELRDLLVREFPEPAQEEPAPQPDPDKVRRNIAAWRADHPLVLAASAWLRDREHSAQCGMELDGDRFCNHLAAVGFCHYHARVVREHSCEEVVRARHYPGVQQHATPALSISELFAQGEQPAQAAADNPLSIEQVIELSGGYELRVRVAVPTNPGDKTTTRVSVHSGDDELWHSWARDGEALELIQMHGRSEVEKIRARVARDNETLRKLGVES